MSTVEPVTRALTSDDWTLLQRVRLRALSDAPDAFGAVLADAERLDEAGWRARAQGAGPTLVVLDDGEPVAMGGVFVPDGAAEAMVWGMWTAPEARGRGHASRILAELVAWCGEHALGVTLHVTEGNAGPRRLYLAHGFEPTGEWLPLRDGSPLRVEQLRLRGA